MSDMTLSLKIQADAKQAMAELKALVDQVKTSGREASAADREAINAARERVKETRAAAVAQRDMSTLGVRSSRAIKEEMDRVNAALERLKTSSATAGTDLTRATQAAKNKMAELKAEMSGAVRISDQLRDAWGQLAGLAASLAVFGKAAKEAIGFESALVDLRRAANVTREEAREMGKEFQDLAVELGMSAVGVTQLATAAAKTGVAKRDLLEFSRIAATAAMNFDMIPEEAGDALAKLKNILGLGVKDMEAFVATLNELADNAATSEREIIEALKLGGGSAIQFGLTAKQSAALATSFLSLGATAQQAGTAMRTLLGRLRLASSGTGEAGKALQRVVGDARQFAQIMAGDASGALQHFLEKLKDMPSAERFEILRGIFQEGLDTENISKLAGGVDLLNEAMGRAAKSDDELIQGLRDLTNMKLESTEAELNKMGAAWRNAGAAVGELFLPMIRAAAVALVAVADAIRYLADAFPALSRLAAIAGVIALAWAPLRLLFLGLGPVLRGLGSIASVFGGVFSKLLGLFGAGGAAIAGLGGKILSLGKAFGRFIPYVGAAVTAIAVLWDAWNWFKDDDSEKAMADRAAAFGDVAEALKGVGGAADQAKNQIQLAMQEATAPIEALVASYKTATEQIKLTLSERLVAIDDAAKRELEAVQTSGLSQRDQLRETARITVEAEQQKVDAIRDAGEEMERAWQTTHGRALEIARAAGMDTVKLEQDATDAKIDIYKQLEAGYRKTVDALIVEEQRHLKAVQEIENQRLLLKMSVEDRIRALKQKTMSDEQAYADRNAQIEEKLAKAKEASAKGQTDLAKRYADEAMSLAERNAQEVVRTVEQGGKRVTTTVVTLEQAVNTSKGQIEQAYAILDGDMAKNAQQRAEMARDTKAKTDEANERWQSVLEKLQEIREAQAQKVALQLEADEESVAVALEKIKALAEAQAIMAKVEADLSEVTASISAWKSDPSNTDIMFWAMLNENSLVESLPELQAKMEAAGLQVPAELDFSPALTAFERLREILGSTKTTSPHDVKDNVPVVKKSIDSLDGRNTSSVHTIYEKRVPMRASGGWASEAVRHLAAGGRAWRRFTGSVFGPGTGSSDSIRAMLSRGEFVVRERATRIVSQVLPGFIERFNAVSSKADLQRLFSSFAGSMAAPTLKLAGGGWATAPAAPSSAGAFGDTMTWLIRAGEAEAAIRVVGSDSRRNLHAITDELTRLDLLQGKR
jgi:TP901 family phage tail tape measure protein